MLAWRLAWRDLRGISGGFRLLALALVVAVAAIAAVGSIADGLRDMARAQAQEAVGGDLSFRLFHRPPTAAERRLLEQFGRLSLTAELRSRARRPEDGRGTLVELKAIDDAYPLYGSLVLDPPAAPNRPPALALGEQAGVFGAAVDAALLEQLDLAIGDRLGLGALAVEIRAILEAEPDRAFRAFALGPRVLITRDALDAAGLATPGATIYWYSRLRLAAGQDRESVVTAIETRFPHAGWRIVDAADGIPGLERSIDLGRALVQALALAILVIGGIGIGGAVTAHLEQKTTSIAILRTLGATSGLTSRIYLGQLAITAAAATALGLAIGAAAPFLFAGLADQALLELARTPLLQPAALATAAAMGLVTTVLFAVSPLARAAGVPPSLLFRALVVRPRQRRTLLPLALVGLLGLALAALVTWTSDLPLVSLVVLAVLAVLLALLWAWGRLVAALARRLRPRLGHAPLLRLALAELGRPGSPSAATIAALGLGLTALATVVTVERLAAHHLRATLPATAPDLVAIDLDPAAADAFAAFAAGRPDVRRSRTVPFLHGRITHLDGRPVRELDVPRDVAWVIRGDRGLSWPDAPVAWATPEEGGRRASLEASIARRLGLEIGDRLTLDLPGRPFEVEIAAVHAVDWTRLDLDFPILLAPPLDPPPHRRIAALWLAPGTATDPLVADLGRHFPGAPVIEVAGVLEALDRLVATLGRMLAGATGLTLLAASLVLAGGIAARYRRRLQDIAVLGLVGAVRRQLAILGALELGLLGLAAGLPASLLGMAAAWAVVRAAAPGAWQLEPGAALAAIGLATALLALAGALLAAAGSRAALPR